MKTLLLIDHNRDNFQFIKEAVASIDDNISCLSLVYSNEAIDALLAGTIQTPFAIFMNLNMPGKTGVQFISELRASHKFEMLPVMFYAPTITSEVMQQVKDLGVSIVFEKPTTIRGWKTAMMEMLSSIGNANESVSNSSKKTLAVSE
jgi:CheY-like chemotaxis protein